MRLVVQFTILAWVLFEAALLLRDVGRGKGSTAHDRGTRSLLAIMWFVAFAAASGLVAWLGNDSRWQLGAWHQAGGVALMWLGLALRIWAVLTLGAAFRTTVEVDAAQRVVDAGPYRLIRHPSYTGMLLVAAGYGLALGNWLSLAILLLIPPVPVLRRIVVEEAALAEVIGQPYLAYQQRTRRLVPGLW
jgi:protein-S-isoprenylcysteine O-methyltransferase Ste14